MNRYDDDDDDDDNDDMMMMMVVMIILVVVVEHVEIVSPSPSSSYLQEERAVSRRIQYVCDGGQSLHSDSSQHREAARPRYY